MPVRFFTVYLLLSVSVWARPNITDLRVAYSTESSAKIIWRTDVPSDSQVKCGLRFGDYAQVFPARDSGDARTTEHVYVVWGLAKQTRYYFLVSSAAQPGQEAAQATGIFVTTAPLPSTPISSVSFGPTTRFTKVIADTLATATLGGVTYSTANDTGGGLLGDRSRNLALYSLSGNPISNATVVNDMSGYGEGGLTGIGNGTWKTGGIFATKATAARPNGVLYLVVGRHQYGDTGAQDELAMGSHQTASAAFMIMSQDKGLTWQNHAGKTSADGAPPPESDPGRFNGLFATPEFVSYAPDGEPPTPAVDNSDAFIYAMSNRCMNGTMGCWNNGDALYLGRVHRDDIGDLDARKWQFYIGGDGDSDGAWGPDAAQAKAIFAEKDHVGQTSAQYVPALNRYVMLTWFYPDMAKRGEDFYDTSVFRVLEAPKPWGPWTVVRSVTMSPQGYYNPMFSEVRSAKGGLVSTVIMSGNWRGENTYRPWTMELRLNQSDEPPIDLAKSGVPAQGLVCFYDMAQRAGSTIPDRSGNHYDLASSAVWDAEGLSLLSDMKTFASVHLNDPLNDFTVFVLFRSPGPIRNSPYDRLLEYHFESGFSINRESNKPNTFGIDVFGADPPNNTPPYGLYSSTFTDGQAHLLVAERKHSEIALYDGVTRLASEGNVPVSPIAPGEFMFGPRGFSRSSATIIAAGLYRRALDDDEIQRLSSALRSLAVARGIEVH